MENEDVFVLIYGFDFTHGPPSIGYLIKEYILDFIKECDYIESSYSGDGDTPYYLGKSVTDFSEGDDFFLRYNEYMDDINKNKEKYKKEIHDTIDSIIDSLKTEAPDYIDDEFTQQDIDDGIAYFEALKTCDPENCTIHGTS